MEDPCKSWDLAEVDASVNDSIDLSNVSFINTLWVIAPTSEIIIKCSFILPIVLWGIFGNISLLYIIIKHKYLHSPTNLLIGNMALADFITLLVHPWVFLAYDIFQNYPLGKLGCKMEGGLECAVLTSSVINLVAISYDRLNSIALPQEKRLNKNDAILIIIISWVSGFIVAAPFFIFRVYKERQWLDFLEKFCTENVIFTNIYWHIVVIMIVWLPLGTMLLCYTTLFLKLEKYEKVVLRRMKTINVNYKKQVAKMMFIVVITFIVCRLPLTVVVFYRNELLKKNNISKTQQVQNRVNGTYYILWFISRMCIFLNAAINPVIYGLTNEKFRKHFKSMFLTKWMFDFSSPQTLDVKIDNRHGVNKNKNVQINETVLTDSASTVAVKR